MLIGVDKDDVLSAFKESFLRYYNGKYIANYSLEDVDIDDPGKFFGISTKEVLKEYLGFKKASNQFMNVPPVEGAVDGVYALKDAGYDLRIVTATPSLLEGSTRQWIREYFGDCFSGIHTTGAIPFFAGLLGLVIRGNWKYNKIEQLGFDVVIDDSIDIAERCAADGRRVLLLDYPWNRRDVRGVERVYSWNDIVEKLT